MVDRMTKPVDRMAKSADRMTEPVDRKAKLVDRMPNLVDRTLNRVKGAAITLVETRPVSEAQQPPGESIRNNRIPPVSLQFYPIVHILNGLRTYV